MKGPEYNRRREWSVWCKCTTCGDYADVVLWVGKQPNGLWGALVEKSTTAVLTADGDLMHRPNHCGGILTICEPLPGPTYLEGV